VLGSIVAKEKMKKLYPAALITKWRNEKAAGMQILAFRLDIGAFQKIDFLAHIETQ
jgi:hypothetical protein